MVSTKNANAMAEVLHYLKGIREEDIGKIPTKLIAFFEENASKSYICDFDYNKSLNELKLLDETRGLISMICLNYWCETEEQKQKYINKLNDNEIKYQEELREKYNPDNLFKNNLNTVSQKNEPIKTDLRESGKENFIKKIINKIKMIKFRRR